MGTNKTRPTDITNFYGVAIPGIKLLYYRDFTYVDDIVEGIVRLLGNPPIESDGAEHKIFNIGNNSPEKLMVFINTLEKCLSRALGREVVFDKIFEPLKPVDVPATYANTDLLQEAVGFKPETSIEEGLQKFADWYVGYHGVRSIDRACHLS